MDIVIVQAFNALSLSSILLLVALGLVFSFGLMNVINMAHGEFIMVGAYVTFVVQRVVQAVAPQLNGIYIFIALVLAFLVSGALGLLLERVLIRHLYGRPLDTLLATWGVGLILQQTARTIFGAPNVDVTAPTWLNGGLALAEGVLLPYKRVFIFALVAICIVAIYFYVTRSAPGRRMRAVMQNRDMASCLGLSTARVDATTFALGSGLAGIAGVAVTMLGSIGPALGTYYIVDAFMVSLQRSPSAVSTRHSSWAAPRASEKCSCSWRSSRSSNGSPMDSSLFEPGFLSECWTGCFTSGVQTLRRYSGSRCSQPRPGSFRTSTFPCWPNSCASPS